ncbi:MAG TPA: hypothetical protein VGD38_12255, partial [Pyrinomonadaceae bacterium]
MSVRPLRHLVCSVFILVVSAAAAVAQSSALPKKLPSVEKIVDNYLKAVGGKKVIAAHRDVTYEWIVQLSNQPAGTPNESSTANQSIGTARTLRKAPASERFELTFGNGQIIAGTNTRSAWELGLDKQLRTLTSLEAANAKLQTTLAASRLVDFKKANVLARVLSLGDLGSEPAYIVEFSTRSGARVQYYFSVKTKLITKITSDAKKTRLIFEDYRSTNGVLEPHRVRMNLDGSGELTLVLQSVKYNTGINDQLFDPPAAEKLDITSLLLEVGRNQDQLEDRVSEYSFKQTETDREINGKGELKKQTVKVYEVYPLPNREAVLKLISENGTPLSPERAAKEEKRVEEEFRKAERDKDKDAAEAAKRKAEREKQKSEREKK